MAPKCRAFSMVLQTEKLKAPSFLGPVGAGDTTHWCITVSVNSVSRQLKLDQTTPFWIFPVSILYKSIAGRCRPVRVTDGPMTARFRFIKNASTRIRKGPLSQFAS